MNKKNHNGSTMTGASRVGPPQGGREGIAAGSEATEAVRKAEASLWNLDAKRTTATVLPA